jgi:hypothetical protein
MAAYTHMLLSVVYRDSHMLIAQMGTKMMLMPRQMALLFSS